MPGEAVFMAPEECGMNSDDQDGIDFIELHNMRNLCSIKQISSHLAYC